jgi:hypothetical protein
MQSIPQVAPITLAQQLPRSKLQERTSRKGIISNILRANEEHA